MKNPLTWDDLLIQKTSPEDARLWLSYWSGVAKGTVAPVFMSKFGDWFLRRPDGNTDELSVIEGTYKTIASTPGEFTTLVNTQEWQEKHLLSGLVQKLHEQAIVPKDGQCYAFAPHPSLQGRIDLGRVMLMDTGVWQYICAQTFGTQGARLAGMAENC